MVPPRAGSGSGGRPGGQSRGQRLEDRDRARRRATGSRGTAGRRPARERAARRRPRPGRRPRGRRRQRSSGGAGRATRLPPPRRVPAPVPSPSRSATTTSGSETARGDPRRTRRAAPTAAGPSAPMSARDTDPVGLGAVRGRRRIALRGWPLERALAPAGRPRRASVEGPRSRPVMRTGAAVARSESIGPSYRLRSREPPEPRPAAHRPDRRLPGRGRAVADRPQPTSAGGPSSRPSRRDPTLRERIGETGLAHLLRDTEAWIEAIAQCLEAGDPTLMHAFADQIVAPYRRRRISMDDLTALAEGFRAALQAVLGPVEQASAERRARRGDRGLPLASAPGRRRPQAQPDPPGDLQGRLIR